MKVFKHGTLVPPGGWWWVEPSSGTRIQGSSFEVLRDKAKRFIQTNKYPMPVDLTELMREEICARDPDWCLDSSPPTLGQRITHFAGAVQAWANSGMKTLSFNDFDQRMEVCKTCEWAGTVNGVFIGCKKCGCTALKLFLPTEKCPLNKWPGIAEV